MSHSTAARPHWWPVLVVTWCMVVVCLASDDHLITSLSAISHLSRTRRSGADLLRRAASDNNNGVVCGSIDIRNNLSADHYLTRCNIIEGSLRLVLIDHPAGSNVSFPYLTQVTHYVVVYRNRGLKSLATLLPNLAVIRGNRLFEEYALVVLENPHLVDLGLHALRRVLRGTVRVERNGQLCYLRTIDWRRLTNRTDVLIQDNKESFLHGSPRDDSGECGRQSCPDRCDKFRRPLLSASSDRGDKTAEHKACWSRTHCQIVREPIECHWLCVGGCTRSNSARHCVACRFVVHNGVCLAACPVNLYKLGGWLCVTAAECMRQNVSTPQSQQYTHDYRLVWHQLPFNGSCVSQCPADFMPTADTTTCQPCVDGCPKVCVVDTVIDSAQRARLLKGCTKIEGHLHIQASGEAIVAELEEGLSSLREITDYLRVSYSQSLLSLNFLHNLKRINGEKLHPGGYSLYFLNNDNLQSLWPPATTTGLRVLNGRAFFHFNHRLCVDVIERLVALLGINTVDVVDIGRQTNGDRVACRREVLLARVVNTTASSVTVEWANFRRRVNDYRTLLGYYLFYRPAVRRNITLFDDRSACGQDVWRTADFPSAGAQQERITHTVAALKSFTQYALYVQTLVSNTGPNSSMAQSPILYFQTLPSQPSCARSVKASVLNSSAVSVEWAPPRHANGIVSVYQITFLLQPSNRSERIHERGCSASPELDGDNSLYNNIMMSSKKTQDACAVDDEDEHFDDAAGYSGTLSDTADEIRRKKEQNAFEDRLQNSLFTKKGLSRRTRAVNDTGSKVNDPDVLPACVVANGSVIVTTVECVAFYGEFNASSGSSGDDDDAAPMMHAVVAHLHYFSYYLVKVRVCHAAPSLTTALASDSPPWQPRAGQLCSAARQRIVRTLAKVEADMLPQSPVVVNSTDSGQLQLVWHDPQRPNGDAVLRYTIHVRRIDSNHREPPLLFPVCLLSTACVEPCVRSKTITVSPGRLSIQVQAHSAAGAGPLSAPLLYTVRGVRTSGMSRGAVTGIVVSLLLLLLAVLAAACVLYSRWQTSKLDANAYASCNPYYEGLPTSPYVPDEWEVPADRVSFHALIGKGSFGSVYRGTALLPPDCDNTDHGGGSAGLDSSHEQLDKRVVAIKTMPEAANIYDRRMFLEEASMMKQLLCHHVVRLYGIASATEREGLPTKSSCGELTSGGGSSTVPATDTAPATGSAGDSTVTVPRPPYVIMELMERGDLKTYLRQARPSDSSAAAPLPEVYRMALQVADGMAYLSSVSSVHRDLAARNCMVTGQAAALTVKIGDFGMARHLYEKNYYKKGSKGLLPVRWMSPESLLDGVYTSHSDVWSYGVVLWEMATYAAQPYQGLSNEEVIDFVQQRRHMGRPAGCDDLLYGLMESCWRYQPVDRPTFVELVEQLLPHADAQFEVSSYYHSACVGGSGGGDSSPDVAVRRKLRSDGATPPVARRPFLLRPLIARGEDLSEDDDDDALAEADVQVDASDASVKFRSSVEGVQNGSIKEAVGGEVAEMPV